MSMTPTAAKRPETAFGKQLHVFATVIFDTADHPEATGNYHDNNTGIMKSTLNAEIVEKNNRGGDHRGGRGR